jgi:phosphoribosylformylglycinamidine cyclo-ligase
VAEQIVAGVAAGCMENGCALVGGETAEMPDFYDAGEYDLAGFIVGVVGEHQRLGAQRVQNGDVLLGLASSGMHTNGYSLARKILFTDSGLSPDDVYPESDASVGDVLLRTHRSYLPAFQELLTHAGLHALAHITGGGIPENLDRVIPEGMCAYVTRSGWTVPAEFAALQKLGNVPLDDMERTFNMGIGMVAVVAAEHADEIAGKLRDTGETVFTLGDVRPGGQPVEMRP